MDEHSTYLFYTGDGSNKEYHAHLRRMDGGWVVQFANGPRGRVGQTKLNTKTLSPVSYDVAKKVFDDLVGSKIKGGYTPDKSGIRFTNTELAHAASGHSQQLPTSITREQALRLQADPNWGMQEKANGERRTIEINAHGIRGINKLGLYTDVPESWGREFASLAKNGETALDGEQMNYSTLCVAKDGVSRGG